MLTLRGIRVIHPIPWLCQALLRSDTHIGAPVFSRTLLWFRRDVLSHLSKLLT